MADRPLSYEEYVLTPIFDTGQRLKQKIEDELKRMNTTDILDEASERYTIWENSSDRREAIAY